MNTIKATKKINCNTCGCSMQRTKSIKVLSSTKEDAIAEVDAKFRVWVSSLSGQSCRVCNSILAST